jgi:hypothetical protein
LAKSEKSIDYSKRTFLNQKKIGSHFLLAKSEKSIIHLNTCCLNQKKNYGFFTGTLALSAFF